MYNKITDKQPPIGKEVWSFNGEHEIKNVWEGNSWRYEFKYPQTHWTEKPELPDLQEVLEVRNELISN